MSSTSNRLPPNPPSPNRVHPLDPAPARAKNGEFPTAAGVVLGTEQITNTTLTTADGRKSFNGKPQATVLP